MQPTPDCMHTAQPSGERFRLSAGPPRIPMVHGLSAKQPSALHRQVASIITLFHGDPPADTRTVPPVLSAESLPQGANCLASST